jgi:eukaryotic-like serine/threonine-protein kinase
MESISATRAGGPAVLASNAAPLEIDDPPAIGGHRLVARLGSGGMGVVYLGRDGDGRLVAVKTARPEDADDPDLRLRFRSEADCARRVPTGWTARVLVDGTAERPPYLITEYVEGPSLAHIIDTSGPLAPEQLRALAVGVARALAAIHGAGLVHRDLKPANVLLTPTGPRIIDFGIAQRLPAYGGLTKDGVVMGSPGWIPPERLTGRPATTASDIFGWGSLVAYAGTGRNPFGDGDGEEIAGRTIHQPPDLTGLHQPLRSLVAAALAKDPVDRPRTGELLARLGADTTEPAESRRRRRLLLPAVAAAGLATAAAVVIVTAVLTVGADEGRRSSPGDGGISPSSSIPPALRLRGHTPPGPRTTGTAPPGPQRTGPTPQPPKKSQAASAPASAPVAKPTRTTQPSTVPPPEDGGDGTGTGTGPGTGRGGGGSNRGGNGGTGTGKGKGGDRVR